MDGKHNGFLAAFFQLYDSAANRAANFTIFRVTPHS
jgi:hypothetical protein